MHHIHFGVAMLLDSGDAKDDCGNDWTRSTGRRYALACAVPTVSVLVYLSDQDVKYRIRRTLSRFEFMRGASPTIFTLYGVVRSTHI